MPGLLCRASQIILQVAPAASAPVIESGDALPRIRADLLLVERGLAETRESARRLIMAGEARVGTTVLVKPATMLDPGAPIEVVQPPRYVSRGGLKLEAALEEFGIDVTGLRCLDIGASTGGFTDCLLRHGAASVLAVDVGRAQLHAKLRTDPRVELRERVNARDLPELPPIDLFVGDVSFISLRKVLPSVQNRVRPGTIGAVLLKPQFEAGPSEVPRGGVIRDEAVRTRVLDEFRSWLRERDWRIFGAMVCPVHGGDGNVEFFLHLATPAPGDTRC
jgi:23S rRNA (cytidine1920-2'-O)/16S rRNA (cytidine1409-2'-O)-methyltransferase